MGHASARRDHASAMAGPCDCCGNGMALPVWQWQTVAASHRQRLPRPHRGRTEAAPRPDPEAFPVGYPWVWPNGEGARRRGRQAGARLLGGGMHAVGRVCVCVAVDSVSVLGVGRATARRRSASGGAWLARAARPSWLQGAGIAGRRRSTDHNTDHSNIRAHDVSGAVCGRPPRPRSAAQRRETASFKGILYG